MEAKALALSQADRLIAQYRCQRAQAEAEVTLTHFLCSYIKTVKHTSDDTLSYLVANVLPHSLDLGT